MRIVTIDFETHPIEDRPHYPPKPVGVAILPPASEGAYGAFGHPSGNNTTEDDARAQLAYWFAEAEQGLCKLLFHNMKFDLAVACEGWGLPMPSWDSVHDTQYLMFLADPHSKTLELKPASEALLGWKPEEKDAVSDYVWENRKALYEQYPMTNGKKTKVVRSKGKVTRLFEWFARIPGDVLAPYANGDVYRTRAIFEKLYPQIRADGMGPAYDRLRRITPILMENERLGMRVDVEALEADCHKYGAALVKVDNEICKYLGKPGLNLDADVETAAALDEIGAVTQWVLTDTGEKSMSKVNLLPKHFADPSLASAFGYRNRLKTVIDTFMRPWLAQAKKTGGTIHTNWNITRGGDGGTRTGRPSTSHHNFLNLAKDFETKKDGYVHPAFMDVPILPLVRRYILPDSGHVFLHRDFSGQELRVFAHFEAGELHDAYIANPKLDPHDEWVRPIMEKAAGRSFDRTTVKVLNFQGIYGGGAPALAKALEITIPEAKALKVAHDAALPGRKIVADVITTIFRRGDPIRTWGGRVYHCEPAGMSDKYKKWMTYEYKGINYEVQGSAADLTIEAILDWYLDPERDPRTRLLVTVYDEINISCPPEVEEQQMDVLRRNMEKDRLSVPMLSDGKRGMSWGSLVKCA